jgi:hypothetical protein
MIVRLTMKAMIFIFHMYSAGLPAEEEEWSRQHGINTDPTEARQRLETALQSTGPVIYNGYMAAIVDGRAAFRKASRAEIRRYPDAGNVPIPSVKVDLA